MKSIHEFNLSDLRCADILKAIIVAAVDTIKYEYCLYSFIFTNKKYSKVDIFDDNLRAKVQLFSLGLIFKLFHKPHYRSPSFQVDLIDNLKNVAIPGTGIPLSIFCYHWILALLFIVALNPFVCFLGACNKAWKNSDNSNTFILKVFEYYSQHLLEPDDWFSLWRLNCALVSYHSHNQSIQHQKQLETVSPKTPDGDVTKILKESGYKQENKWTFLTDGKKAGVPVSPFFDDLASIVCKNINVEGGMGIHFFKNAAYGGDWILQERMSNATWLSHLLPTVSPLSTMRVITTSTWALKNEQILSMTSKTDSNNSTSTNATPSSLMDEVKSNNTMPNNFTTNEPEKIVVEEVLEDILSASTAAVSVVHESADDILQSISKALPAVVIGTEDEEVKQYIKPVSAVLRLGRADAVTDHSSVLFNVDLSSGVIGLGTTNHHWYQLGVAKAYHCPWLCGDSYTHHPDAPHPEVTGKCVPGMQEALDIVTKAHMKMMPDVPIVGWDVAFTLKGVYLLEVNLSCNFFKGKFNMSEYTQFVHSYFTAISDMEE